MAAGAWAVSSLRYLFHDSSTSLETFVPTIPDWKGLQPFSLP